MSGAELTLQVNGDVRAVASTTTIADLVRDMLAEAEARAVAVARNGAVVPRAEWASTTLVEGDVIEVMRPVQGG